MRLIKFTTKSDPTPRVGQLDGERVLPLAQGADALSRVLHSGHVLGAIAEGLRTGGDPIDLAAVEVQAPIDAQEVWGAGVTYERQQGGAPGRVGAGGHVLRSRLPGSPAGAFLQGHAQPRRRAKSADPGAQRYALVRSGAGAGSRRLPGARARRFHDRQRRQRPRYRGREPALSPPGQGLRRLLRPRPRDHTGGGDATGGGHRDQPGDRPRGRPGLGGEHVGRSNGPVLPGADRLARPRQPLPRRRDLVDRDRNRPSRRFLAAAGRPGPDHDSRHRHAGEPCCPVGARGGRVDSNNIFQIPNKYKNRHTKQLPFSNLESSIRFFQKP